MPQVDMRMPARVLNTARLNMVGAMIVCAMVVAACEGANADVPNECRRGGPAVLSACTSVINNPSVGPADKSLAYQYRGESQIKAGFNRPAISDLSESIRLNADNSSAYSERGRAKLADSNLVGSIEDFTKAIFLSPESSPLYVLRGHAYIVGRKFDAAIEDLSQAIRLYPSNAHAWNTRGVAYEKRHDFDTAIQDFTKAIELLPYSVFYANRGYAYESKNLSREAIEDFQQALLLDPSLVEVQDGLKRMGVSISSRSPTSERVREGRALAQQSCSGCHEVEEGGDRARNATAFRSYYKKRPLIALRASITRVLRETHYELNDQNFAEPKVTMTDGQIDSLVAYMNSLSTAQRLGNEDTSLSNVR